MHARTRTHARSGISELRLRFTRTPLLNRNVGVRTGVRVGMCMCACAWPRAVSGLTDSRLPPRGRFTHRYRIGAQDPILLIWVPDVHGVFAHPEPQQDQERENTGGRPGGVDQGVGALRVVLPPLPKADQLGAYLLHERPALATS